MVRSARAACGPPTMPEVPRSDVIYDKNSQIGNPFRHLYEENDPLNPLA